VARSTQAPLPPRLPASLGSGTGTVLEDDAEWSGVEVTGDFSSQAAVRVDVTECRMLGASFTSADLTRARVSDTAFVGCELSGATFHEAALTRVEFRECRMLGFGATQAQLRNVRFVDCRLDGAELRMAVGERVQFEHCSLVGADFYAARLADVRLFDSDLTEVEFSQADLTGGRLHGSKLERLRGARYLSGVTIDSTQVVSLALEMFAATGVRIDDERDAERP
jgi:uncharacterized protein YjbI with pentapeptide repeats